MQVSLFVLTVITGTFPKCSIKQARHEAKTSRLRSLAFYVALDGLHGSCAAPTWQSARWSTTQKRFGVSVHSSSHILHVFFSSGTRRKTTKILLAGLPRLNGVGRDEVHSSCASPTWETKNFGKVRKLPRASSFIIGKVRIFIITQETLSKTTKLSLHW